VVISVLAITVCQNHPNLAVIVTNLSD